MLKIILFYCIFFSISTCFSFNKIDSLKKITREKSGEVKLNAALKIAEEYSYLNNGDTTLYYANKSLDLAQKLNNQYACLASKLYMSAGYFSNNKYNESRKIAMQAFIEAKEIKHKKLILQLGYMIARTYQKQHTYSLALNEFKSLLSLFFLNIEKEKYSNHIYNYLKEILKQISYTYFYAGESHQGIKYFKEIEKKELKKFNSHLKRSFYANISFLYIQGNNLKLAQEYLFKALKISKKSKILNDLYQDYAYLSNNYFNLSDYKNAIKYNIKALEIAEKQKASHKISWILNNLSTCYLSLGDIKDALDMKYKSLKLHTQNKDSLGIAYVHSSLAENFIRWRNPQSAKLHINKALNIHKKLRSKQNILACYKIKCRIDVLEQQYDSLYLHNKLIDKSLTDKIDKGLSAEHLYFNGILEFYKHKDIESAIVYFQKSWQIARKIAKPILYFLLNKELSKIYLHQKEYNKALNYAKKSWELANKIKSIKEKKDIAIQMSKCYEAINKQDSVLKYIKIQNTLNEEIFNQDNILAIYQKERLIKLDQINQENKTLLKQNKSFYQKLNNYKYYIGFIIISLVCIGIVILRVRKKKFKQTIHLKEIEKKAILSKAQKNDLKLKSEIVELEKKQNELNNAIIKLKENELSGDCEIDLHNIKNKKIATQDSWTEFLISFNKVYPNFLYKLRKKYTELSPNEERILILIKLKLKTQEMANVLSISSNSLNMARYRLRKKIGLQKHDKLENLVEEIV